MNAIKSPDQQPTFKYDVAANGCWIWSGYCDKNGYSRIYNRQRKRIEWAHRFSYELHVGPISEGHEIDHTCQVTNCVNPTHLQQLTRAEHVRVTLQRLGKNDIHLAAAQMRRLGATYAEIADALKYSGREGARCAVISAIRKGLVGADEIPKVVTLSDAEREEIVELVALGIPQGVIADYYRIHNSQVSRVSRGIRSGRKGRRAG